MRIAIIGAGFTGLSAAYYLQKAGNDVTVFEKDTHPGGLAVGFKPPEWEWSLEKHYHHFFTNDNSVLNLAEEVNHKIIIKRPKTSVYANGNIYQLDSPLKVLTFPLLDPFSRVRMGASLAALRFNPFWKSLEKYKVTDVLPVLMGERSYKLIWEPQMQGKFGEYSEDISLAWFWARIKKRTSSLAYPEGGFLSLAERVRAEAEQKNTTFLFDADVVSLEGGKNPVVTYNKKNKKDSQSFDRIIVTLPSFPFLKIAKDLPNTYQEDLLQLKGLGAINVVLRLSKQFFSDNTYWLSECEKSSPIMAIVEHTNFMNKKHYNHEHLVYVGKYLPKDHKYFSLTDSQLLDEYHPHLSRINPMYRKHLISFHVFKAPFAQPIIPPNYSKILPPFTTPLKNVYMANIQQVYPWDRGTNYAVELGYEISDIIQKS